MKNVAEKPILAWLDFGTASFMMASSIEVPYELSKAGQGHIDLLTVLYRALPFGMGKPNMVFSVAIHTHDC